MWFERRREVKVGLVVGVLGMMLGFQEWGIWSGKPLDSIALLELDDCERPNSKYRHYDRIKQSIPYTFGEDGTPLFLTSATITGNEIISGEPRSDLFNKALGSGAGMKIGIWDRGLPLWTHQELKNRLVAGDDADSSASDHATMMSSVLLGAGINPKAKGIVPDAQGVVHDWSQDRLEAAQLAAEGLLVSCHAYGMESASVPDFYFGKYLELTRDWDRIMAEMPYYLMVTAAGNHGDLGHNASPIGTDTRGGWDLLLGASLSKNGLTVGAADTKWDQTYLKQASVASYSSVGPSDDGRIKPDLAMDGRVQLTASGASDVSYASAKGTSIATAKVSGHLLQLQAYYHSLYKRYMWASTVKGLALHTCVDVGSKGPDYKMGWGIMDMGRAAEVVRQQGYSTWIVEDTLKAGEVYTLDLQPNGEEPLEVSLSWTDPEGEVKAFSRVLNAPDPALINDLDLRLLRDTVIYQPWVLDKYYPNQGARTGDNRVDPFEHISVGSVDTGTYTLEISHKGQLSGGAQKFSLIVSGVKASDCRPAVPSSFNVTVAEERLNITWEDEGNADAFELQFKAEGDSEWQSRSGEATWMEIDRLAPNIPYVFRVRAICGTSVTSDYSPEQSFELQRIADELMLRPHALNLEVVFPEVILLQNPVQNALILSKDLPPNTSYRIYKGTGKLLRQGELRSNRLDVDGFAAGLYILSLECQGIIKSLRFLKK
ncbi:S8 family serine peptidase [Flagellimonas marinaquae]